MRSCCFKMSCSTATARITHHLNHNHPRRVESCGQILGFKAKRFFGSRVQELHGKDGKCFPVFSTKAKVLHVELSFFSDHPNIILLALKRREFSTTLHGCWTESSFSKKRDHSTEPKTSDQSKISALTNGRVVQGSIRPTSFPIFRCRCQSCWS